MIEIGFAAASGVVWLLAAAAVALHCRATLARNRFLDSFWSGNALENLKPLAEREKRRCVAARMFLDAMRVAESERGELCYSMRLARGVKSARLDDAPQTYLAEALAAVGAAGVVAGMAVFIITDASAALIAGAIVMAQAVCLHIVVTRLEQREARANRAAEETLLAVLGKYAVEYETR